MPVLIVYMCGPRCSVMFFVLKNATVDAGSTVLLTCVALAKDQLSIEWIREGNETTLSNRTRITIYEELIDEGDLTFLKSILEICRTDEADSGLHSCLADDGVSNDTVMFQLNVLPVGGK